MQTRIRGCPGNNSLVKCFNFWSETYRWKSKERYCKHREARSNNLSHPSFRHRVPVSDGRHGDHPPPEGVGVALEVGLERVGPHGVLLGEVDEVAGEDETEEADVQRRDQLLQKDLTLVTNLKDLLPGVPAGSRLDFVDFIPQSSQ